MGKRLPIVALRLALLLALTACVVLQLDYQSAAGGSFCGAGGGCAAVRASRFSRIGPVGLPMIGLVGFSSLFAASLVAPFRRSRVFAWLLGLGALGAVALIAVQVAVVGALCPWCMVVDVSAVVAAAATLWQRRRPAVDEGQLDGRGMQFVWAGAAAAGVAIPLLWPTAAPEVKLPPELEALQRPGQVTVISFTDFECPFCRRLNPVLHALYDALAGSKSFQRKMVPLAFHRGAESAARAYLCAPATAREAMAKRLYRAGPKQMTKDGVAAIAAGAGIQAKAFAACYGAATTSQQIQADKNLFKAAGLAGLPATFVNRQLIVGADEPALQAALQRARAGGEGGSDSTWMLATLAIVFAAAVAMSLRLSAP